MIKKTNLYLDIHVLQTVPPSCVNRDDTGSPKTAVYGGVTRARVSSQAWKHSIRQNFHNMFNDEKIGMRTKHVPAELAMEIAKLKPEMEEKAGALAKMVKNVLDKAGIGIEQKKDEPAAVAKALFFVSRAQLKSLAQLAVDGETDKNKYINALQENPALDIALFGRMVAGNPSLNFDAAAQVAHAISTHAVHNEYDYFTAVDDCEPSWAGHLGTIEFNSSTLYRYATVNILELKKTLDSTEDAVEAAIGFAESFIYSMPDGKQNTFANRTIPDLVYITIRKDMPVIMCGAFEKPIPSNAKEGYVSASKEALVQYAKQEYSTFIDKPEKAFGMGSAEILGQISEVFPHAVLMEKLKEEIISGLTKEDA